MTKAKPYLAPPLPEARGTWLTRSLVALFVEHRLPYTAAVALDRWCRALGFRHKTVKAGGFSIRIRRMTVDEQFIRNVIVNREYSGPGFEIHESDVVIDIGANIGTYCLLAGAAANAGKVFAFEPNGENYQLLLTNIQRNGLQKVVVPTRAAVTGKSGAVKLYCHAEGGFHTLVEERAAHLEQYETVPGLSLQEIMDTHGIGRCDLLKLDCEGAEYDILFNLPPDYYTRIGRITMEYHGEADRDRRQAKADSLVDHLERMGFDVVEYIEFVAFRGGYIRAVRRRLCHGPDLA